MALTLYVWFFKSLLDGIFPLSKLLNICSGEFPRFIPKLLTKSNFPFLFTLAYRKASV